MKEPKTRIPTIDEIVEMAWVAAFAKDVVKAIIVDGHADPADFISLCSHLETLEGLIPIDDHLGECEPLWGRAEDLHQLRLHSEDPDLEKAPDLTKVTE